MIKVKISEYEKIIEPYLTKQRFYHSKCVAKEAGKLAKRYGADVERAKVAGILHDIMKDTAHEEQLKIINRFGIILDDIEREKPKLWHAISGAAYVEHVLNIDDPEILSAIRYHTTGRKNMTLLEKVIFIADYTSEDRTYSGVERMRAKAKESLELAMIEGITFTFSEQFENKNIIGPDMLDAYNDAIRAVYKSEIER